MTLGARHSGDFGSRLRDPRTYALAIEHLVAKRNTANHLSGARRGDVPLSQIVLDRRSVSRMLAAAVASDSYRPEPAVRHTVRTDKLREVFSFSTLDLIVHGAVARLLGDAMEPELADGVYSYRRQRSAYQAVRALCHYLRRHRAASADPRQRGLFVIRADVRDYGRSVPVGDDSPLWPMLSSLVGDSDGLAIVKQVVRPPVLDGSVPARLPTGLAVGSPVATTISNLYLSPVDHALESLEGGFYARFGDDLLFAHPDPHAAARALALLEAGISSLGLHLNQTKHRYLFFNGAGRRCDSRLDVRGTTSIEFLGTEIAFGGAVRLPPKKQRALRAALRRRVSRAARALSHAQLEERARAICEAVSRSLEPNSPLSVAHARALSTIVDDRAQLLELDRWLSRLVATAAVGRKGLRAHRQLPPRKLRELGLPSLVARRNGGAP